MLTINMPQYDVIVSCNYPIQVDLGDKLHKLTININLPVYTFRNVRKSHTSQIKKQHA